MQNLTEERVDEEIRVFRYFAKKANLTVVSDSIEKRNPPEPDILCRFSNGSFIAFELVEVCHPMNAVFRSTAVRRSELIEETYLRLPSTLRHTFDSRFAGRAVSFAFSHEATNSQIRKTLPHIFVELVDQPEKDNRWVFSERSSKVLLSARLAGRVYEPHRPAFNIVGTFEPAEDLVVETVQRKLRKTYKTPYPIELLAHFEGQRAWGRGTKWQKPLREILDARGLGPFGRIWVLGWIEVQFVYPSLQS